LLVLLGGTLFILAGELDGLAYVLAASAVALALFVRPSVARADFRWLDIVLIAYVALIAVQLIPLPPLLRLGISPALRRIDLQLRIDAPVNALEDAARPLTVDADATTQSLWLGVAVVLVFWCARSLFARGGVRAGARTIAGLGMVTAAFGIAQHATAPRSLYWLRTFRYTEPFGPYLNRSDFAMWMVMALPLTGGYLLARMHSRRDSAVARFSADGFDDVALFLTVAMGLMVAALMVGLSRSGIIGVVAAAMTLWALSEARLNRHGRARLLAGIGAVALIAVFYANASAVATRIADTVDRGMGGRLEIWRATLPMIREFWRTGVGAGGYERAMIVYQPAPHETYFNHAHNEYLQLLTEGGLMLAIPAAVAVAATIAAIRRRLAADHTVTYWVRVGAVSGMVGAAVQSLWETGLRRPANTLLFAVLAAFALQLSSHPSRRASDDSAGVGER
jgi:O-antigen ligase/polysaccharide polymerase Wzy-like membrane protein